MTIAELEAEEPSTSHFASVPATSIFRIICIFMVVVQHAAHLPLVGGASLLLLISGHFFAKTRFAGASSGAIVLVIRQSLVRILAAYFVVITVYFTFLGFHGDFIASWYLLTANFGRWEESDIIYPYWFISSYVHIVIVFCLLWAIPLFRRTFRPRPLLCGYAVAALGVVSATAWRLLSPDHMPYETQSPVLLHLFAIGWCIAFSKSWTEKTLTSAVLCAAIVLVWWEFSPQLSATLLVGGLGMIWVDAIHLTRRLARWVALISASSFYIYLAHVLPLYLMEYRVDLSRYVTLLGEGILCFILSSLIGVGAYYMIERAVSFVARWKAGNVWPRTLSGMQAVSERITHRRPEFSSRSGAGDLES